MVCFTIKENPLLIYKGVEVQVLGIAPEKGIKFGVNDFFVYSACHFDGYIANMGSNSLGWRSWCLSSRCLESSGSSKVGLQTSDVTLPQVWNQVDGFNGLFRGVEACILRGSLFTAVCFPLYAASVVDSSMNCDFVL